MFLLPLLFFQECILTCDSGTPKVRDTPSQQECWTRVWRNDPTFSPFTDICSAESWSLFIFCYIVFEAYEYASDARSQPPSKKVHADPARLSICTKPSTLLSAALTIQLLCHLRGIKHRVFGQEERRSQESTHSVPSPVPPPLNVSGNERKGKTVQSVCVRFEDKREHGRRERVQKSRNN